MAVRSKTSKEEIMVMNTRLFVPLVLAMSMLMLVTGCGRSFSSVEPTLELVEDPTVVRPLQYQEGLEEGKLYAVEITLPEEWVGQFVTRNTGNVVHFDYVTESDYRAPIFSIEALSRAQFWEQQGSYPGQQTNILSTPDTYFVYHLPIDAWYSGLPEAEFEALAEIVPSLIATVDVMPVQ